MFKIVNMHIHFVNYFCMTFVYSYYFIITIIHNSRYDNNILNNMNLEKRFNTFKAQTLSCWIVKSPNVGKL